MPNKKPSPGAQAVKRHYDKRKAAGLQHIKVWSHPGEAAEVRKTASEMPLTKAILEKLK